MVIPFAPQRRNVVYRSAMMRAFVLIVSLAAAAPACAAPCIAASTGCTEWVALGGGPSRSLVYRTYPLDTKNEQITRALVMVHGAGRDADHYFTTALAATFLAGALDDAIVISPRFASNVGGGCKDTLVANEVNWPCNGDSWRSGGIAKNNGQLTSFDLTDEIL